ncbi:DNA polymerase IV [Methanosarcinaceae archaeon]|nr:DNA polymerase IV [Methanosarcinaceae archaeon]
MDDQKIVMHIDMDSFFASVEMRDRPDLAGKPVVVCSRTYSFKENEVPRGVVSAASYPARKFGIHSAMPVSKAQKLCPETIFLPMRKELYQEVSKNVMAIIGKHVSVVQRASIDEAYADPGEDVRTYEEAEKTALAIKNEIYGAERITCSVGIGPNRTIAKIASGFQKPDGLTVVRPENVRDFLDPLPVGKLPGVGSKTLAVMNEMGILTVGDLAGSSAPDIFDRLGKGGLVLRDAALGIDNRIVTETKDPKSVSRYYTFDKPTGEESLLMLGIDIAAEDVDTSLRSYGFYFKTVTINVIFSDYTMVSRSVSHPVFSKDVGLIRRYAKDLFRELMEKETDPKHRKIRRISVGVSALKKIMPGQMTFDNF